MMPDDSSDERRQHLQEGCGHLGGVKRLDRIGPMKQARPMAAKSRPSVVELSPSDCMLGRLLKRTCRMSDAPHTIAPLAFISANAAASLRTHHPSSSF